MKKIVKILLIISVFQLTFSACKKNIYNNKKQEDVYSPKLQTDAVQTGGNITVNIGDTKQTIDLIGAGTYFYSGHLVNGITNYTTATNWLYQDLNVNVFKIVLWATNVEDVNDNSDPNVTDFSKFNFTANSNLVTQITLAKRAIALNPNIKIWAIVLSPPKFLKTNNSVTNGGTLNASYANAYNEFGEFIFAHLKHLKDNSITVSYLSLMNEPDFGSLGVNYDSAEFTPTQAGSVYTNTGNWLKTKLTNTGITNPQFVSPDCININNVSNYITPLNNSGNIDKFSTHQYSNSSQPNFTSASNLAGTKGLYMTEWHAGFGMGDNPDELTAAFDLVNKFHDAFRGGAKGWLYFEWGNPASNFGGLLYTPYGGDAVRKKNYFVYKQFTDKLLGEKYIPTVLSGITNFGNDNVSAFTTTSRADINIMNWSSDAQNRVRMNFGGNIKTINIYRTSATESNALVWTQSNVNLNYYDVDFNAKSFTTVRITW
jgi:O-glycosyl hydrolase